MDRILGDSISGSTGIALKIIEFYRKYATGFEAGIYMASEFFDSYFAGMGIVRNVNRRLLSCLRNGGTVSEEGEKIVQEIGEQVDRSLDFLGSIIPDGANIVTISRSSQFERAIMEFSDRIGSIYVLESRPMQEGVALHRWLQKHGLRSTLIADAAMSRAVERADIALTGSDSILGDYTLIHKIGTLPLFSLMNQAGKECNVLSISMKQEASFDFETYPEFRKHPCQELQEGITNCENYYFEKIPERFVTSVISDLGVSAATHT